MCRFKSAIILKDRVFITDVDSHTELLEQLKIADTRENAEKLFVRAELYPENNDVFSNINNWVFNVDQDILPEWFVREYDKQRMAEAVKKWAVNHIYIDQENIEVSETTAYLKNCKNVYAYDNSKVYAYGNSKVYAYDNSKVTAYGNSKVYACDNSTVEACGNSKVTAYDNSKVYACDNSKVYAYDNSKVYAYDNSTVVITAYSSNKKENISLKDNATLKDCNTKTIYQSGDWKFERV